MEDATPDVSPRLGVIQSCAVWTHLSFTTRMISAAGVGRLSVVRNFTAFFTVWYTVFFDVTARMLSYPNATVWWCSMYGAPDGDNR